MKGEHKKNELRNTITTAAIDLIKKTGYENATMEEIARRSEITKRTLYKYFPVKEAIIEYFIKKTIASANLQRVEYLKTLKGLPTRISFYLNELIEGVLHEPELFEKYIVYLMQKMVDCKQTDTSVKSGIADPLAFIISEGIKNGEISDKIPVDIITDLFLFSFVEISKIYYKAPVQFDLEESIALGCSLFIKAVKSNEV